MTSKSLFGIAQRGLFSRYGMSFLGCASLDTPHRLIALAGSQETGATGALPIPIISLPSLPPLVAAHSASKWK